MVPSNLLATQSHESEPSAIHALSLNRYRSASDPVARHSTSLTVHAGRILQRHERYWSFATGVIDDVHSENGLRAELSPPKAVISMAIEEVGGRVEISSRDDERRALPRSSQAEISILPAGSKMTVTGETVRFLRHFTLEIDDGKWRDITGERPALSSEFRPAASEADVRVSKICRLLATECSSPNVNGSLYADSLLTALLDVIARSPRAVQKADTRGGLAPWQLRRAQAYMLEHMAEGVSLLDLANLVEVSQTHFSRAFKASMGCAPHQWLISTRIEESKRLLVLGSMPISEIALALGFCDQAHFTRLFSKMIGTTPLAWQKSRRG